MHSNYVIEQSLYTDVNVVNQGRFTAVATDALILYSNYLIEQILHMDVKCTAQAISLLWVEIL